MIARSIFVTRVQRFTKVRARNYAAGSREMGGGKDSMQALTLMLQAKA